MGNTVGGILGERVGSVLEGAMAACDGVHAAAPAKTRGSRNNLAGKAGLHDLLHGVKPWGLPLLVISYWFEPPAGCLVEIAGLFERDRCGVSVVPL